MGYAIELRIDANQFVPANLRQGRLFINKSAFSRTSLKVGQTIHIPEFCEFAEVLSIARAARAPAEYNFILG